VESVQLGFWVVALLVLLAVLFDFMNGFHDAANSIATVVSTGVLKPHQAVLFAAFFNVVAIFVFHLSVAATVGKGIAVPGVVDTHVVFGALIGAICWNLVTWWYGIPSSSSHALIGGISGAALAKAGTDGLLFAGIAKTVLFIFLSPLFGFLLGSLLMVAVAHIFRQSSPMKVDRLFRRLQLVSAGLYSLGHGGNDAQKTIGLIWMLLIATGYASKTAELPPTWVIWACYIAIGLGTMFGGWRIVKTMGQKITKLRPVGGFCAEAGGALTLFLATGLGVPVSTTHTITGAIVAPTMPPISACELDDGMPYHQVITFQAMAPTRAPNTTCGSTTPGSTMPLPIVLATERWKTKIATMLKKAANRTACCGLSTPVDTTVAIELAASWKPFMKSNRTASSTSSATTQKPSWTDSTEPPGQEFSRTMPSI
jgi:PiT family inorganic phosphate transporter